uniref:Cobalamin-binding protein n=1 Tax=Thermofilum pendens TaxID=2269 RepID=A0A7J3X719_THEPE
MREISAALVNLDEGLVEELVARALEAGCQPVDVVEQGMRPGMEEVGRRFEGGEYFLSELIIAADIFQGVLNRRVLPLLPRESKTLGRVVIGTVRGDIHDIGKNLVAAMLRVSGFEVIDLGVDVPPERFVEAVREYRPDIVGMSALLTTTMLEMRNVIDALRAAGLRDKVKIIVGGAPVTEEYAREIGADAYARNAVEAVRKCSMLMGEVEKLKKSD